MSEKLKEIGQDFVDLAISQAKDAGLALRDDLEAVRIYAAERLAHLASCVGQPGYAEAVSIEANNVAMQAAIKSIDAADEVDARIIALLSGALAVGAKAISIAV